MIEFQNSKPKFWTFVYFSWPDRCGFCWSGDEWIIFICDLSLFLSDQSSRVRPVETVRVIRVYPTALHIRNSRHLNKNSIIDWEA